MPECALGLIDSHCHLDAYDTQAEQDAVIDRAMAAGVVGALIPGWHRNHVAEQGRLIERQVHRLDGQFQLVAAAGIHPVYVGEHEEADLVSLEQRLMCTSRDLLVAVGEIGLDRYLEQFREPLYWARQQYFFREQLKLAVRYERPVLVHVRHCYPELVRMLEQQRPPQGVIVHAFNGREHDAAALLAMGCKLGIGGLVLQPSAHRLRALIQSMPADGWVLETDAPDMLSFSARQQGYQRNEPALLVATAYEVAGLLGWELAEVAEQNRRNIQTVLHWPPETNSLKSAR